MGRMPLNEITRRQLLTPGENVLIGCDDDYFAVVF